MRLPPIPIIGTAADFRAATIWSAIVGTSTVPTCGSQIGAQILLVLDHENAFAHVAPAAVAARRLHLGGQFHAERRALTHRPLDPNAPVVHLDDEWLLAALAPRLVRASALLPIDRLTVDALDVMRTSGNCRANRRQKYCGA